jgi:osmotically-inducible protein OsmY
MAQALLYSSVTIFSSRKEQVMHYASRLLSITFFVVALVSGCTALTGKSAGTNVDDAGITASVKTNLASERGMQTLTSIDVDTNRGVVSLNGVVESSTAKQRAVEIARQTSGVKSVVNNLQVTTR